MTFSPRPGPLCPPASLPILTAGGLWGSLQPSADLQRHDPSLGIPHPSLYGAASCGETQLQLLIFHLSLFFFFCNIF